MKCKQCNSVIDYNSHYHCFECSCGKTYNSVGQELQPVEDWKDEYNEDY